MKTGDKRDFKYPKMHLDAQPQEKKRAVVNEQQARKDDESAEQWIKNRIVESFQWKE